MWGPEWAGRWSLRQGWGGEEVGAELGIKDTRTWGVRKCTRTRWVVIVVGGVLLVAFPGWGSGLLNTTGPGGLSHPGASAVLLLRTAVRSCSLGGVSVGHSSEARLSPARCRKAGRAYCPGRHRGVPRLCRPSPPSLASPLGCVCVSL